jgi:hypothetical protein
MNTDERRSGMRRVLTVCLLLVSAPCFAQHAGLRQQWQPQTEGDPRLQQRVETELVCISTRRGLPLLAGETGVSLSVAPENLDTTGERKFTVIAKGATLKEIMVQLCAALRECHWDVDTSGAQPAYLLHRNAGVEAAERERQEGVRAETQARRREERAARVEEARRALAMGPEELAELEKTDPFLARALRYPPMRNAMEAFFSLPAERIQELAATGRLRLQYSDFPPKAQQLLLAAVRAEIAWEMEYLAGEGAGPDAEQEKEMFGAFAQGLPQSLEEARIGVFHLPTQGLVLYADPVSVAVIPPRHTTPTSELMRRVFEGTGDTKEAATEAVKHQWMQWQQRLKEEEQQRLRGRALAPEVEQPLEMPLTGMLRLSTLEKAVAERTGLSVIADAYWGDQFEIETGTDPRLTQLPARPSVRQALDAASSWAACEWWTTGRCLVLRAKDFDWYNHARGDVPESVVFRYREKLRAQGRFTLDDALALADEMGRRGYGLGLPEDLQATGLGLGDQDSAWAVALLLSLTPEERARAEGAEGLRLADLSQAQRDVVTQNLDFRLGGVADAAEAVFRVTKSEGTSEGRRYTHYQFRLRWGEGEGDELQAGPLLFDAAAGSEGTTDEHR